jgi:hypothetical protein
MKADILKCARCGGQHLDLKFKALTSPRTEFDLWTMCPVKQEPILLVRYKDEA